MIEIFKYKKEILSRVRSYVSVLILMLILPISSGRGWQVHTILSLTITCIIVVFVETGKWISKKHAHSIREMVGIFSLSFVMIVALTIYLTYVGEIDRNGNANGRIASYYITIIDTEMNFPEGLKFSAGILCVLLSSSIIANFLSRALGAHAKVDQDTKEQHLGFGIYLSEPKPLEGGLGVPEIRLSFRPIKFFTVLVMKCFCAATATFSAISLVIIIIYPSMGHAPKLKADLAIYFVTMLGIFTLMAILINEEATPFIDLVCDRSKKLLSRGKIKTKSIGKPS